MERAQDLDGVAAMFFLAGIAVLLTSGTQSANNLGWVLMIIGIVKQLMEWK